MALIGRAVAEIGEGHIVIAKVFVSQSQASPQGHLRAHNAVATVEVLFFAEHMHRAALALGVSPLTPRQLGHHAFRVHSTGQHMAVIAVGCDALVALFGAGFQAHHNGLLADIKMAKSANQAHAIKLASLFLKAADQQHLAVKAQKLFLGHIAFLWFFLNGQSDSLPAAKDSLVLNHPYSIGEITQNTNCA